MGSFAIKSSILFFRQRIKSLCFKKVPDTQIPVNVEINVLEHFYKAASGHQLRHQERILIKRGDERGEKEEGRGGADQLGVTETETDRYRQITDR